MKITQIKFGGVREPLGYAMEKVCISWKVTDTQSQKPKNTIIRITAADEPEIFLAAREGADLNHTGECFVQGR